MTSCIYREIVLFGKILKKIFIGLYIYYGLIETTFIDTTQF